MLEPPELLNNGEPLSNRDKETLDWLTPKHHKYQSNLKTISSYHGPVIAQKVKPAPNPHILLRPVNENFDEHVKKSFSESDHELNNFLKDIPARQIKSFAQQFEKDINVTLSILKDNPFFAEDFHIVIDKTGKIYHTDLDGRFEYIEDGSSPTPQGDLWSFKMVEHVKTYLAHWLGQVKNKAAVH